MSEGGSGGLVSEGGSGGWVSEGGCRRMDLGGCNLPFASNPSHLP